MNHKAGHGIWPSLMCKIPAMTDWRLFCLAESQTKTFAACGSTTARLTGNKMKEKGDRSNLCEAPFGPFRQIGPVPFSLRDPT